MDLNCVSPQTNLEVEKSWRCPQGLLSDGGKPSPRLRTIAALVIWRVTPAQNSEVSQLLQFWLTAKLEPKWQGEQ